MTLSLLSSNTLGPIHTRLEMCRAQIPLSKKGKEYGSILKRLFSFEIFLSQSYLNGFYNSHLFSFWQLVSHFPLMCSSSWLFHFVQNYPHLLEEPKFGHLLMGFQCNPFKIHLALSKDLFTTMQKIFQGL